MKYYKNIENGYIVSISTQHGQVEISEAEYSNILFSVRNAPIAQAGFVYRLREDLTWKKVEVVEETETAVDSE